MAPGPLFRVIAQGVLLTVSILARALPAAYATALANARKSGADKAASEAARKGASFLGKARISKEEALQVLNLAEQEATPQALKRQYDRYFEVNKVENGGSFYLQSKIFRAKELLDEYVMEKEKEGGGGGDGLREDKKNDTGHEK